MLEMYRRKKGLSYRDLAAEIGCDYSQLFRLLTKEYSSMDLKTFMPLMNWLVGK